MPVINTNLSALIAQNAARASELQSTQSMERLSTGLRINSAKDDAAGLAIATRMTSAIRGLGMSLKNASDGISMAQTAEGALGNITDALQRLRELAVQSANGSNSNTERSFLDSEALGLVAEVARIGAQTNFNNSKLLNGTFGSQTFQLGYLATDSMVFGGIDDSQASALGNHKLVMDGTGLGALVAASTNNALTNTVNNASTSTLTTASGGTTAAIAIAAGDSAKQVAFKINAAANSIGVTAVATNAATLSGVAANGTITFTLSGAASASVSASITNTSDLTALAAAINGVSNSTGITATFANPTVKSSIQLTSNDGSDIKIANYVHSATANTTFGEGPVDLAGGASATTTLTNTNHTSVKSGIVTLSSTKGAITAASGNTSIFITSTQASTFDNVQGISIASQSGASAALSVIDSALTQVNNSRANLGGLINRFEASISSQSNSIMNLSESRSRILDADYAKETSMLAKSMIIQQAATAMLGQANQNPRLVLHLLK
jgi:flagellin